MSFREFLIESIDEGFSSIGRECKQVIYFHLEQNFMLNKQNIPDRIEEFSEALEKIFGFGSNLLKSIIMKNLFKKLKYPVYYLENKDSLDFVQYVYYANISNEKTLLEATVQ